MGKSAKVASVLSSLSKHDRSKLIPCLSGLLLQPGLQANSYRIETMIGMAFLMANGQKKPSKEFIGQLFRELGESWVGSQEDPSEDLFTSNVTSVNGNFKILNGLWPGAAFYLELFLEVLELMPSGGIYDSTRQSCFSLLAISDEVLNRARLSRYVDGFPDPIDSIPEEILKSIRVFKNYVIITDEQLKDLGVEKKSLDPFTINRALIAGSQDLQVGHSKLECCPIVHYSGYTILANPSAVSAAIRNLIISTCLGKGFKEALFQSMKKITEQRLRQMHKFGGPHTFQRLGDLWISELGLEFDKGHWIQVIAFIDNFDDYYNGMFSGVNLNEKELDHVIPSRVKEFVREVSKKPGFRGGMTLLVGCGWGRGLILPVSACAEENWLIDGIAIHDLETMSWLRGSGLISLWKTLDMQEQIRKAGTSIFNASGLLNLIGWERRMDGHQVPHSSLPHGFSSGPGPALIQIPTSELKELRREASETSDPLMLMHPSGRLLKVYRTGKSLFEFEAQLPAYASLEFIEAGRLLGVCIPKERPWWVEVKGGGGREQIYQFWEMMMFWLKRTSAAIEDHFDAKALRPITWTLEIEDVKRAWSKSEIQRPLDPSVLFGDLVIHIDPDKNEITVYVPNTFQPAFFHPENHAESMLVRAFLTGSLDLLLMPHTPDSIEKMLALIVPSRDARHIHMFMEKKFRDVMLESIPSKYMKLSRQDGAWITLGLVDIGYPTDEDGFIRDRDQCKALLNLTVKKLEKKLADGLKHFDRTSLITALLLNYESTAIDKDRWRNTAKAMLALNEDKDAALEVILEKEAKRNAIFLASRIVIEAANCECIEGGIANPGEIEITRLLAIASSIFSYGGWSDAIHWGIMDPMLKVSPYGDIMTAHQFEDRIANPYGRDGTIQQVRESILEYETKYDAIVPDAGDPLADPRFLNAWESEFGVSLKTFPKYMEVIETCAYNCSKAVYTIKESELLTRFSKNGIDLTNSRAFLHSMKLMPRSTWWDVPDKFSERDRQAWRFRRRLSVLRFPIIQINLEKDPDLLISPSLVGESIGYLIWGFHSGSFPDKGYPFSDDMKGWLGIAGHMRGIKFNKLVSEKLKINGWETESDLPVSKLMQSGFGGINFGDVDVLAWNVTTGRVLVIECKDLIHSKTYGEICQRMVDYLGDVDSRGRPDLLKKHLERMEVVRTDPAAVKRFTNLSMEPTIESHIVFHNQVPMNFSWDEQSCNTKLWLFSNIDGI